jgi:hypothetical protein
VFDRDFFAIQMGGTVNNRFPLINVAAMPDMAVTTIIRLSKTYSITCRNP